MEGTPSTKKDRGKKNTNLVKIGHLNSDSHEKPLSKMDNLRQSQPAGPPSSPSQLEGILYSLIIMTHCPASFLKAARVRSPQSDQVKCQLQVSLCALGPWGGCSHCPGRRNIRSLQFFEYLLVHSILTSRGGDELIR